MHGERQRHAAPDRLGRRATDRVEDLTTWVLLILAMLAVVVAAAVAGGINAQGRHRVDVETRERTQVEAVLLEPAPRSGTNAHKLRGAPPRPVTVTTRYTTPDGVEREAHTRVVGPLPAGARVPVWVDRSGAVTAAPMRTSDAVGRAVTGALGVLALAAAVLGGIWTGVRRVVLHLDLARWEREWAQVEPRWSGRAPR